MEIISLGHHIFAKEILILSKNLLVRGSTYFSKTFYTFVL